MNSTLNATINVAQNVSDHIGRVIVTITPYPTFTPKPILPTPTPMTGLVYLNGKIQEVPVMLGTPVKEVVVATGSSLEKILNLFPLDLFKGAIFIVLCLFALWGLNCVEKAVVNYWEILKSRRMHDKKEKERRKP